VLQLSCKCLGQWRFTSGCSQAAGKTSGAATSSAGVIQAVVETDGVAGLWKGPLPGLVGVTQCKAAFWWCPLHIYLAKMCCAPRAQPHKDVLRTLSKARSEHM